MKESEDFLALGGESFRSRLFVGTGKFSFGGRSSGCGRVKWLGNGHGCHEAGEPEG